MLTFFNTKLLNSVRYVNCHRDDDITLYNKLSLNVFIDLNKKFKIAE